MAVIDHNGAEIADGASVEHYVVGTNEYTVGRKGHFIVEAVGTAGDDNGLTVRLRARDLVPAA